MKISVVMVDGSFRENFHIIDSLADQTFPKEDYEVLWVEFYAAVNDSLKGKDGMRVITLGNSSDKEYHSSYCFNEGIRQSKGEVLIIPDADVMVEPTFLETVWKEHQSCDRLAMYFHRLNEPKELHDKSKSYSLAYLKSQTRATTTSNFGGCLTARKKWLMEINGYEQHAIFGTGAHANGYDVNTRLKNLGLHIMWHPTERLYHPWHPGTEADSTRYKLQHLMVEYKASTMMTKAFQGIDPNMDSELPGSLQQKLLADTGKDSLGRKALLRLKTKLRSKVDHVFQTQPSTKERFQFIDVGFHGDKYLLRLAEHIANRSSVFVETGANVGSTLAYVARSYPELHCLSCEPDPLAFERARTNTGKFDNVTLFNGTSQQFIEHLARNEPEIFSGKCFFWLDAHGYGFEWPLKKELEFITGSFDSGYILIDDFKVPGRDDFLYDKYQGQVCSYDYVKDALDPRRQYQLYYPTYKDKTSSHHPLCGWGLLVFGHDDFRIPEPLADKMERAL